MCQTCAKTFYTHKVDQQIYCSTKCRETHEYDKPGVQAKYRDFKRRKMQPHSGDRGLFYWDPYSDEHHEESGDHYRINQLGIGIHDETEEVLRMLRDGIVWARFAELSTRRIPFQEAINRLERAVEYEYQKQIAKKTRKELIGGHYRGSMGKWN